MQKVLASPTEIQEIRDAATELNRISTMTAGLLKIPGSPNSVLSILPPLVLWLEEVVHVLDKDPEVTLNVVTALRVARSLKG